MGGVLDYFNDATWSQWLWVLTTTTVVYIFVNSVYLLHFHPAAKFPGPKLAAVSYLPYCYHWMRGRFPWFVESALHEYGDAVRVGPNEVVFYKPEAAIDIYGSTTKSQELFLKTDLMDFGTGDLGYIWQNDPVKRKAVARRLLPAFSTKAIKSMEPIVNMYMDIFVSKMKELGTKPEGLLMNDWLLWLGTDLAADLAYNRELHSMRDGKTSDFAETLRGTSFVGTLMQLSKKLPMITLITPFFISPKVLRKVPATFKANSVAVKQRIDDRGKTRHPDFMDYMISPDDPPPSSKKELIHVEQVAFQMFVAGFDPIQIMFYAVLFFLVKHPKLCAILTEEIRDSFKSYEEITPDGVLRLKYLHAFVSETFRVHLVGSSGFPRLSPGATVDGTYVPKGITCSLSTFTAMRSENYFRDPLEFHPERWLPSDHTLFDTKYVDDNLKSFFSFSIGPRQCPGREVAWSQIKQFLGKVLWSFDLEPVSGHDKSFDRDFKVHIMWERPDLYLRFIPAKR